MQKIILIPKDENQEPIDLLINRVVKLKKYIKMVLPDGEVRYLPKDQVKEWKLLSVDEEAKDGK